MEYDLTETHICLLKKSEKKWRVNVKNKFFTGKFVLMPKFAG